MEATCIICQHRQTVPTYDDWDCNNCGQKYEYEEDHRIVLSDRQLAMLRQESRTLVISDHTASPWDARMIWNGNEFKVSNYRFNVGYLEMKWVPVPAPQPMQTATDQASGT